MKTYCFFNYITCICIIKYYNLASMSACPKGLSPIIKIIFKYLPLHFKRLSHLDQAERKYFFYLSHRHIAHLEGR